MVAISAWIILYSSRRMKLILHWKTPAILSREFYFNPFLGIRRSHPFCGPELDRIPIEMSVRQYSRWVKVNIEREVTHSSAYEKNIIQENIVDECKRQRLNYRQFWRHCYRFSVKWRQVLPEFICYKSAWIIGRKSVTDFIETWQQSPQKIFIMMNFSF